MPTQSGNDILDLKGIEKYRGRKIALVTNHSSLNSKWEWLPERLAAHGIQPSLVFSPEHGLFGAAREGEEVGSYFDSRLGAEVVSLYGDRRDMHAEDLADVDVVIYDMQDAGVRFYTLISTLRSTIDACAAGGRELVVLDRPNPLTGNTVRGPVLDPDLTSFVGIDTIPLQYSMTPGELALYWSAGSDNVRIVEMKGWKRAKWYDQTGLPFVAPSPNLPDFQSMLLYPGLAVLEGINVSVGRGTTRPFRLIGAPWLDGHSMLDAVGRVRGILARYARFVPWYGKFKGEVCEGVEFAVADRSTANPVLLAMKILLHLSALEGIQWTGSNGRLWAENITGVKGIDRKISDGSPGKLIAEWDRDAKKFMKKAEKFLLYS